MPKAKTKKSPKSKVAKVKAPKPIGEVTHFFGHIDVAIVKFNKPMKVGARVKYKGATTDFEDTISSMQFDHKAIASAKKGAEVGIKVKDKVRDGDLVFDAE